MYNVSYLHAPSKINKTSFIWILPICLLMVIASYILSSTIFPLHIDKHEILGHAFSKGENFNYTLFVDLIISITLIAIIYLLSQAMNIIISKGNTLIGILLAISIFCFTIGINIPLIHMTKFWIIKEDLSLVQILQNLKFKGEIQLYWIMLCFTFIIPILKTIALAYDIFISRLYAKNNLLLSILTKWAMLDVLIIAVLVVSMKSGSGIIEMTTGSGLSFFVVYVFLSLIISSVLPYTKNN